MKPLFDRIQDGHTPDPSQCPPADELDLDTVGASERPFYQWKRGFRMGADTVALATYALETPGLRRDGAWRIAELCAGTGLISCKLGLHFPNAQGIAVELQPQVAALLACNLEQSGLSARWTALRSDLATWLHELPLGPPPQFDLIVINPPWYVPGRGRTDGIDRARDLARTELSLDLPTWVQVAKRLLAPHGRLVILYDSQRLAELFLALDRSDLKPIELVPRITRLGKPAKRCFIRATHGHSKGDLALIPELILPEKEAYDTPQP